MNFISLLYYAEIIYNELIVGGVVADLYDEFLVIHIAVFCLLKGKEKV